MDKELEEIVTRPTVLEISTPRDSHAIFIKSLAQRALAGPDLKNGRQDF